VVDAWLKAAAAGDATAREQLSRAALVRDLPEAVRARIGQARP
jgi:hypothetical protein